MKVCPIPAALPAAVLAAMIHSVGAALRRRIVPEKYGRPHHHERVQAVERMRADRQFQRDALATMRRFNARLSAKGSAWFWPKVTAAITTKHPKLMIEC
jgi:hypothetical protein